MNTSEDDANLLAQFVATFEKLDCLSDAKVPSALMTFVDEYGSEHWRPRQITALPSTLQALYQGLGFPGYGSTRFPPLYEALLLSYRWTEIDIGNCRLLTNEPAEDFSPLLSAMRVDAHLSATLVPNGYIQFGKGPDVNYDPVCFDFRQRQKNGDCRIVQLDHEAILCNGRIGAITEIAPNFRSLVLNTIHRAASQRNNPAAG